MRLRNPKTTQERRQSFASPTKVRAKRNYRNIPNAWDDIAEAKPQRSWKKFRKNRWK